MKGTDTTFLGFVFIIAQELPHSLQEWSEVAYIIKDKSSNQFITQETGRRIVKPKATRRMKMIKAEIIEIEKGKMRWKKSMKYKGSPLNQ